MDNEKMNQLMEKENEIGILRSQLASDVSEIGDYKITKIYEARLLGKDDPYNLNQLISQRDAVRDKINALQAEVAKLEEEMKAETDDETEDEEEA